MLVAKRKSVWGRTVAVLMATLGVTAAGVFLAAAASLVGLCDWPPRPSSAAGAACGLLGGAVVLFEMALLGRKWLRKRRLGAARHWMRLHVWLGLACLPVILVHTGFGLGGPLTSITAVLFYVVIASGVWGLVMQQWLPQKILADVPGETVASQVDFTGQYHADEAVRLVAALVEISDEDFGGPAPQVRGHGGAILTGQTAADLRLFATKLMLPYLRSGRRSGSSLASRAEVERRFARFRELTPPEARTALDRLEELCDLRRQWDLLVRLQFWLHNWLVVHVPLSVAMTGLMILHAVRALKYW